jgi:hypothetical protein
MKALRGDWQRNGKKMMMCFLLARKTLPPLYTGAKEVSDFLDDGVRISLSLLDQVGLESYRK